MAIALEKIILSVSAESVLPLIEEIERLSVNSNASPELTDLLATLKQIRPLIGR